MGFSLRQGLRVQGQAVQTRQTEEFFSLPLETADSALIISTRWD